jgi:hypothetical protein
MSFLKVINSECINAINKQRRIGMERARVVKDEVIDQERRFLAVYLEAKNSCLVLLSEREDKLGTLAIAVPKPKDLLGPPLSSILVGDRNAISARMFAENLASVKGKIALVSIYLESTDERQAQSVFKKLLDRVSNDESQRERLIA